MSVTASGPHQDRADVELRVPADGVYVSVLRTTTAGLAARLDFTIDDIEDLRIAVGEACAMVLSEADPASDLLCRFWLLPGRMTVSVSVDAAAPAAPDEDSFAWQVLTTLASAASVQTEAGRFGVTMTMKALDLGDDLEATLGAGL
ncbi:anti-sigma factor [Nocardioides marmotae]|uniref:Anti-sigma factor n=1 Tax=Nocardioides marmotae TaxID=2663857 RepID=A0A6I3JAY5_9ACTN|nr:anti-sigma factor [Nocardioides marmotae]MCR6031634.1 anti-sigma factor [Gordonia jinghuaiqii]MBC9733208.1 anti-sigma factor [Nocardioides marmotae]MTB84319.1 anti-sigma factor [Nocardioides marmotae]MTB95273.1 anti-sigma factor [Nocardioides marmotae]QKE02258.1 anti-sigma factor [Nocardioides marmotae]